MTEQEIAQILAETERFAEPRPVWPSVLVLTGLTFLESFSKPILRRLRPDYRYLPESLGQLHPEFNHWVAQILPDDFMQVFSHESPEEHLPSWLSPEAFQRINHNVGKGVSQMAVRRMVLRISFVPIFLLSLVAILYLDLRCMIGVKDSLEAGEVGDATVIVFFYLWLMSMTGVALGVFRRS